MEAGGQSPCDEGTIAGTEAVVRREDHDQAVQSWTPWQAGLDPAMMAMADPP